MPTATRSIAELLETLHIEPLNSGACYGDWIAEPGGDELESLNPATGEALAKVRTASLEDYERKIVPMPNPNHRDISAGASIKEVV